MDAGVISASIDHFTTRQMIEQNQPGEKEKLLEDMGEGVGYLQAMVTHELEYLKLNLTEKIALAGASLITVLILVGIGLAGFAFLAVAMAVYLGNLMGSLALGFLVMAGVSLILLLILYLLRKNLITRSVVAAVIQIILNDDDDEEQTDQ